jgi:NAD-dependent aldehyde dehydrogenases
LREGCVASWEACATFNQWQLLRLIPATGEKLKEFSPFDDAEIEKRLSRAEKAFKSYRRTP